MMSVTLTTLAVSSSEVYADIVTATTDKTILIPVKIRNNMGIMGFKITAEYDETVLASPKITTGEITQNGMMDDSIGISPDGTFDVVWSGTQNVATDGTLFIISFKALKAEDTQIKLSYSQTDTFNEAWEDVELKCSDISVKFSSDATITEQETVASTGYSSTPLNSEEIKNAVDIVLDEAEKEYIDEISAEEKEDFVDRTNEVLSQLTGKQDKPFESVEEIKDAYNNAVMDKYVDGTLSSVDSDKIDAAINNALDSVYAESIEQILAEKKDEFVQNVEKGIAQYAPDVDTISDKLTADEAIEAIKQLQSENAEAATDGKKVPEPLAKNNTATIITVVAAIFVAAVIMVVTFIHMKRKKNKEAK